MTIVATAATATFFAWPRSTAMSDPAQAVDIVIPAPNGNAEQADGVMMLEVFVFPTAQPDLGRKANWNSGLAAPALKAWAAANGANGEGIDVRSLLAQ